MPLADVPYAGRKSSPKPRAKAAPKAPAKRSPPSMLDRLPAAKGDKPTPVVGHTIKKLAHKIDEQRAQRQSEARDTKGDADRQRAETFKRSDRYAADLAAVRAARPKQPSKKHAGGGLATIANVSVLPKGVKKSLHAFDIVQQAAERVADDTSDIVVNAIPSVYHLAKTAVHDPKAAAKMVVEPYIETAKHPVKSFIEHPVGTALLLSGVKGGVGRGIGKTARVGGHADKVPGVRRAVSPKVVAALKDIGSTERAARTVPGTNLREDRQYSKDFFIKAAQKDRDRRAVAKRGDKAHVMGDRAIKRAVDEHAAASEDIRRVNRTRADNAAAEASGGKDASAATVLAAQGIAEATPAALRAEVERLTEEAKNLTGDRLRRNRETRERIESAIDNLHPDTQKHAEEYARLNVALQHKLAEHGLLDPKVMEEARLQPYAISHMKARVLTPTETKAAVNSAAERVADLKQEVARRRSTHADAVAGFGVARGRAQILSREVGGTKAETRSQARSVPEGENQHAGGGLGVQRAAEALLRATKNVRTYESALKDAEKAHRDARDLHARGGELVDEHGLPVTVEDIRAHMQANGQHEPAFVSHAPDARGARNFYTRTDKAPDASGLKRTGAAVREGTADLDPAVLRESMVRTQGLVDAADRFGAFVKEYGYREGDGDVTTYRDLAAAKEAAAEHLVDRHTGDPVEHAVAMTPVKLNPFNGRRAQLEATLGHANEDVTIQHAAEAIGDALAGKEAPGEYVLVPKVAADRMREHLGSGQTVFDKAFKVYGSQFRRAVLATSPKWLTGNVVEAALRSMVAHAGPRSYFTGRRAQELVGERRGQGALDELQARTVGGGHFALSRRNDVFTPAEQFSGTQLAGVAKAMGTLSRAPGAHALVDFWAEYTHFVFNTLNGRVEHGFQTAMLGKALRDHPLMSEHLVKLSDTAMRQAADGLTDVNTLSALGREVDRMYGRYGKFSPSGRRFIAGYTPFIAWSMNAVYFLAHHLPREHPVLMSVLASAQQASEEWRKDHGLVAPFFHTVEGQLPPFLQGSIPGKNGSHLRVSRYTPFGISDTEGGVLGAFASSLLPQIMSVWQNANGNDWTGKSLAGRGEPDVPGRDLVAAAVSFIEQTIPITSQIHQISGAHLPNDADGKRSKGDALERLRKLVDPFMYTPGTQTGTGEVVSPKPSRGVSGGLAPLPALPSLPALPPIK